MKAKDILFNFIQLSKYDIQHKFKQIDLDHIYNKYYDICFFKNAYEISKNIYDNLNVKSVFEVQLDFCNKIFIDIESSDDYLIPYVSKFESKEIIISIKTFNITLVTFYDILHCLELCYLKYCLDNQINLELIGLLNNVNHMNEKKFIDSINSYQYNHTDTFDNYVNNILDNNIINELCQIQNIESINFNESIFFKLYDSILNIIIHKYINNKGII